MSSRSGFAWYRALSPRERGVVFGGAVVVLLALVATSVVLPAWRRWSAREQLIGTRETALVRLRTLVRYRDEILHSLAAREARIAPLRERIASASTPAIAAADLESLLRRISESNGATVEELQVSSSGGASGETTWIPARLSVRAPYAAMLRVLDRIEHGERRFVIDDVVIEVAARGAGQNVLLLSLRLRAPFLERS